MWLVEARTVLGRARVRVLLVVLAAVPVFLVVAVRLSGARQRGTGLRLWTGFLTTLSSRRWPLW